jgi:hypothetical protein
MEVKIASMRIIESETLVPVCQSLIGGVEMDTVSILESFLD